MAKARVNVGDVFTIPIDAERVAVGQVVGQYLGKAYYLVIFDGLFDGPTVDCDVALQRPIILMALSFDARFAPGMWSRVDSRPVDDRIHFPLYAEMVETPGRYQVVDYSGQRRREATATEVASLPTRKLVSPMVLEKAVRNRYGHDPWMDVFEDLLPSHMTLVPRDSDP